MARAKARDAHPEPSLAATALAISREGLRLLAAEARLLRTELREKTGLLWLGVTLAGGGAVLLLIAIALLVVALIGALIEAGLRLPIAALIVFAAVFLVGGACLWLGLRQLRLEKLMPMKTIEQVHKDFESITPEAKE